MRNMKPAASGTTSCSLLKIFLHQSISLRGLFVCKKQEKNERETIENFDKLFDFLHFCVFFFCHTRWRKKIIFQWRNTSSRRIIFYVISSESREYFSIFSLSLLRPVRCEIVWCWRRGVGCISCFLETVRKHGGHSVYEMRRRTRRRKRVAK